MSFNEKAAPRGQEQKSAILEEEALQEMAKGYESAFAQNIQSENYGLKV